MTRETAKRMLNISDHFTENNFHICNEKKKETYLFYVIECFCIA